MHIFLGIDVDDSLAKIRREAELIDKSIGFKNSCFTLPLHISLKTSFRVDDSIFDNVIEDVVNYYLSIKPFKIEICKLEMYDNIIWVRMRRNKELDIAHDDLNKMLLDKYNICLHEYDLDYKYHTTLFMDNDTNKIKKAYALSDKMELPSEIIVNRLIIGVSEVGELGSYSVYKEINIR